MKLIYTGYKWRPMKTEELAIMCKERILPTKPENPVASDIINVEKRRIQIWVS